MEQSLRTRLQGRLGARNLGGMSRRRGGGPRQGGRQAARRRTSGRGDRSLSLSPSPVSHTCWAAPVVTRRGPGAADELILMIVGGTWVVSSVEFRVVRAAGCGARRGAGERRGGGASAFHTKAVGTASHKGRATRGGTEGKRRQRLEQTEGGDQQRELCLTFALRRFERGGWASWYCCCCSYCCCCWQRGSGKGEPAASQQSPETVGGVGGGVCRHCSLTKISSARSLRKVSGWC